MARRLLLMGLLLAVLALSMIASTGHAAAGFTWCRTCAIASSAGSAR